MEMELILSVERFVGEVNSNLICPICMCVLNDPVQDENEHTFCKICINRWLEHQVTCPIDRTYINRYRLKQSSRLLKNLLAELELTCNFKENGCTKIIKLEQLESHLNECLYQPNKIIQCPNGCEKIIERNEIKTHNCIRELKHENNELKKSVHELNLKYKMLEDGLLNLKTGDSGVSGDDRIQSVFLSYNLIIKLFIVILFILIIKHNLSTELLLAIVTISILLILLKIFFLNNKPLFPQASISTVTVSTANIDAEIKQD